MLNGDHGRGESDPGGRAADVRRTQEIRRAMIAPCPNAPRGVASCTATVQIERGSSASSILHTALAPNLLKNSITRAARGAECSIDPIRICRCPRKRESAATTHQEQFH